jgi:thioesterase domain-containing protein/acyl carrier protein
MTVGTNDATRPGRPPGPRTSASEIRSWIDSRVSERLAVRPGTLDMDQPFSGYGLDSFVGLELVGELAEWLGCDLSAELFWDYPSINELAAQLERMLADHCDRRGPPLELGVPLVPLKPDGSRLPIYLVPGGGGGPEIIAARYARLGRHLDAEQPLYAFNVEAHHESDISLKEVARLSEQFAETVIDRQDGRAFVLAGDCVGGLIAWETARRMSQLGMAPRLLVLMDTPVPTMRGNLAMYRTDAANAFRRKAQMINHMVRRAVYHLRNIAELRSAQDRARYVRAKLRAFGAVSSGARERDRRLRTRQEHRRAVVRANLAPYSGDVALLVPSGTDWSASVEKWRSLARGRFQVHQVAGDHSSFLKEHVEDSVDRLQEVLTTW